MKRELKSKTLLTLVAVAAIAAAGCASHRHPAVTQLPDHSAGSGTGTSGLGTGGTLGSGPGGAGGTATSMTGSGIPTGPGHAGWNSDTNQFAAQTVYFDFDRSAIKSTESDKIATVASFLTANPRDAVQVEGHCDERGTEEYNRALGERRALAVREELVRLGVAPDRVDTISYGQDRPADPGHNEEAYRRNRRGVFDLLTPP